MHSFHLFQTFRLDRNISYMPLLLDIHVVGIISHLPTLSFKT